MSLAATLWRMLTARQRRSLLAMQLLSLAVAVSAVTGIAAIAPFFAVLGDPGLISRNAWLRWLYLAGGFASARSFVVALGLGFIAIVVLANLIGVLGALAMHRFALRIGTELQTTLFDWYLSRPYPFHTRNHSTALLNRVVYESTRVTYGVLENGFALVTSLVTAVLIIVSIVIADAAVAVAVVGALTGGYALIYLIVRDRLLRSGQAQSRLAGEQAQIASESFGAIKEISVLQAQGFFSGMFARASHELLRAAAHSRLVAASPRHLMECVAAAGLVSLALLLAARDGGTGPWLGSLTFLAFAAYRLLPTLQQAFAALVRIRADRAALDLIGPDLRRARTTQPTAAPCPQVDGAWRERPRREIRLSGLWYRYGTERSWALRDVSLRIPARTTVGIVGANGSGKSTLVDVIAGLLPPTRGAVLIDDRILDEGNRASWQARIAYVPQSIFLRDASIAHNIALGVAAVDEQRLLEAARLAQLDELIATLPHGYAERVGERGVALSGGERQRIGIARALYRDAPVLLLDEATQALDGLSEQELIATLARLHGRYTIVLIAHRMQSVRACDVIFELESGRLAGCGTYERLLQSSPGFRRLAGTG